MLLYILFFVFPLQHLQQAYTLLLHNGIWLQIICNAIYPSVTNLSSRNIFSTYPLSLLTDGREVWQMICNNKLLSNKAISIGCRDCRDLHEY